MNGHPADGMPDRLYNLLPAVYRMRDAAQGYPLRGLLAVISEQVNVIEADIAQLYHNWFIETCQDWVVPLHRVPDRLHARRRCRPVRGRNHDARPQPRKHPYLPQ